METRDTPFIDQLVGLEGRYAKYSESLVLRRLLQNLGLGEQALADMDEEVENLRRAYESAREAFVAVAFRGMEPALLAEASQRLDELLLLARREALTEKAGEFVPEGVLPWRPTAAADERRKQFLGWLAGAARGAQTEAWSALVEKALSRESQLRGRG